MKYAMIAKTTNAATTMKGLVPLAKFMVVAMVPGPAKIGMASGEIATLVLLLLTESLTDFSGSINRHR